MDTAEKKELEAKASSGPSMPPPPPAASLALPTSSGEGEADGEAEEHEWQARELKSGLHPLKVNLEWISNDSARRASFKKRQNGLLKKVAELSTLCDVKACLIVYPQNEPQRPEVWPSPHEANRVLTKLQLLPEMEQSKKMMNQEGFMRHRIAKLQEQLRKHETGNRELETTLLMYQGLKGRSMNNVEFRSLASLSSLIELKLKHVQKRKLSLLVEKATKEDAKNVELPPMEEVKKEGATPTPEVKEKAVFEVSIEEIFGQEWLCEMMNSQEESMAHVPFFEHSSPALLDAYFPNK